MKTITYVKNKLGVTSQTVRNYVKAGKLKAIKSPSGRFMFEEEDIARFLGSNITTQKEEQIWAYYVRSSSGDKVLIKNQIENLSNNYPEPKFVFKESGSGLNENRVQLNRLIKKVKEGEITDIAITQRDRLARFGTKFLLELFESYNVKVHILFDTNKETDLQKELMKDFMSLIASFSGKFYRLRSIENKIKLLEEAQKQLNERSNN